METANAIAPAVSPTDIPLANDEMLILLTTFGDSIPRRGRKNTEQSELVFVIYFSFYCTLTNAAVTLLCIYTKMFKVCCQHTTNCTKDDIIKPR